MHADEQQMSHPDAGTSPASTPHAPNAGAMTPEMEREMERAMEAATAAPARPLPQPAGVSPAKAIRGPRVVQAGREHRKGRVVSVGPSDIFLEFGPKELGVAQRMQWPDAEAPKVNDELEVVVDRYEPNEQLYICSRPGAVQKAAWELLEAGQIVEARVTGVNKGGLELEVAGHRAFMPAGRVDVRHIPDLSIFVGEKMTVKITQVDRSGRGNIVVSRKELMAEQAKKQREALQEKLAEGQTLDGVVKKIMPFGAFVDIGGVDGLVHISDLTHDRIRRVEDAVKEGQTVTVKVLKLDWENDRISLGMKQVMADPFQQAAEGVKAGEVVTGRVTKLLEFGAFVEVAPGVEGLVHISEMAWKRIGTPSEVVQPDQVVQVKVLEVDPERRRISLSIKQTSEAPEQPAAPSRGEKSAFGGGGGGRGGAGKGRRGEKFSARSLEEIQKDKESPAFRRMKEQFQAKQKAQGKGELKSGLGDVGGVGLEALKGLL